MKNFKKLIKEAHLGNPLNEIDRATRVDKMLADKYEDEDYKDSERYADVRADLENEDKLPDGFHSKEDLDQFLKDNPFDSERYKKLSIAQKQDILSYLNRDTEKEFERRMAMREELDPKDFPANFFYGGKIYVFDRIAGGDRAVYYNPKYKGDYLAFGSKKQMDDFLGDYVEPKGGTQSSHFGTNEGTCGYGEDGKVDPENTDKLKPAGPINEVESGDIVTYKGKDHTVMRIEDDDLGVRVYIRPNEEAVFGGKKDTFWVKPEDLNEMLMQALPVEKLTDEALLNLLNNLDDDTGKFTNAKSQLMKAAGDEVKRRGLKIHYVDNDRYEFMNEDMNDPVLVRARAAKMAAEKEKAKQVDLDKKYGSSFMDKLDAEIGLKQELQDLKDERAQLMIDMEQEAEPEGGEIADRYGSRLNDIDAKMAEIKSELDDLRMYESVNEGYLERAIKDEKDPKKLAILKAKKEFFDNTPKEKRRGMSDNEIRAAINKLVNEAEIPSFLTRNKAFKKAVDDSVNYNDFEKRVYHILGPKYFKLTLTQHPGVFKDYYDSIRDNKPKYPVNLDEDEDEYVSIFHYYDKLNKDIKDKKNKDEIDEELFTPNEIGDEAVEKEADSAAYESLQESLRKKLQDRLK